MGGRGETGNRPFDVEIGASATARRVRFEDAPETRTEFVRGRGDEAESETTRENLPERIEPGAVYRDVRVAWRGGVRIDPRLEEATGEESQDGRN